MRVFISYPDGAAAAARRLAEALTNRGLEVRHLNGAGPTGYEARQALAGELTGEDAIVFLIDGAPTWLQRTVLSEVIQHRWAGDDLRILTVTAGEADLPGVLEHHRQASTADPGWEDAVATVLEEADEPPGEFWTPARRRRYRRSLEMIARHAAADAVAAS